MLDRLFLPILGALAAGVIALALVWPQGLGDRSPAPFGHTPVQRTPEMKAAMQKATDSAVRRMERARQAVRELQTEAIAPSQ
ncbi:hypothetical protein [Phenylobacterium sp.]|uniref:hypothetical protein n=1 Tax=Phenylobacterium sp. TaxID=1871053 RepID=UPI0027338962|nr:hypothetical protein [Phenylobacterium sp.]MDP3658968.1 hypothetical protein [Phenylobacterium sp.]